jgi:hypothetical protein
MEALRVFYNETDQAHSPTSRYKVMEALKVFCLIQTKLNPHQQVPGRLCGGSESVLSDPTKLNPHQQVQGSYGGSEGVLSEPDQANPLTSK